MGTDLQLYQIPKTHFWTVIDGLRDIARQKIKQSIRDWEKSLGKKIDPSTTPPVPSSDNKIDRFLSPSTEAIRKIITHIFGCQLRTYEIGDYYYVLPTAIEFYIGELDPEHMSSGILQIGNDNAEWRSWFVPYFYQNKSDVTTEDTAHEQIANDVLALDKLRHLVAVDIMSEYMIRCELFEEIIRLSPVISDKKI